MEKKRASDTAMHPGSMMYVLCPVAPLHLPSLEARSKVRARGCTHTQIPIRSRDTNPKPPHPALKRREEKSEAWNSNARKTKENAAETGWGATDTHYNVEVAALPERKM
jgi:hypothetical protein